MSMCGSRTGGIVVLDGMLFFGGELASAVVLWRNFTFLDRKVTKRVQEGTKAGEIVPSWREN